MAKEEPITVTAIVRETLPNAQFQVELENGQQILAHAPILTDPGGPLECSDPKLIQPTFAWEMDTYDVFKVFMGASPGFEKGTRVTSGKKKIKTGMWTPKTKKWKRACEKAIDQAADPNNPVMYVRVDGKDRDLPKKNPAKRRSSPVVQFAVTP